MKRAKAEQSPQVPHSYRCPTEGCGSELESAGKLPGLVLCAWCGAQMAGSPKKT
jgi:hypothetical protein